METRSVITICGEEYTFIAEEPTSYMQKVGTYVDSKMNAVLKSARVGRADAAVLTAANITDELFKAQEDAEHLRSQLKEYVEEANRAKAEASDLKREVFRLQNGKHGNGGNPGGAARG